MVTTRQARHLDADGATRLAHAAFRHYTARIGRAPAPMRADHAAAIGDGTMWVAEGDGRLLGFVVLIEGGDHLLVDSVAVDPHVQGRGVGTRLLALAEDVAARRGHRRISLCTNEAMTENLDYYARRGYVETHRGEQDGYRRVFLSKAVGPDPRGTDGAGRGDAGGPAPSCPGEPGSVGCSDG